MIFNGYDFSQWMRANPVRRIAPPVADTVLDAPGLTGSAFIGTKLEPLVITMFCRLDLHRFPAHELPGVRRQIARALTTDGPAKLEIGDEPGVYYMAKVTNATDLSSLWINGSCTVEFTAYDPVAYGEERSVTVPSGGSVTFHVGGTWPAKPRITASAAYRNGSALVWGLRLDDGDFVHVATGSASARSVDLDCGARTCVVNGSVALPTLDSDWLELEPGEHTLRMDYGTGSAVVSFVERWL